MTKDLKVYFMVISAVVLWGTSWLASKTVLQELSALNLAILRLIVVGFMYYILVKWLYKGRSLDRRDLLYTWGIGTFCIGGYFLLQCSGLDLTTTVNSSIIVGSSPILTTLISSKILRQERFTLYKLYGSLIGFIGVILIFSAGGEGLNLGSATLKGDLLMLASATIWALFSVLSKKLVDKYDPFLAIAYAYIFGAITLSPLALKSDFLPSVKAMSIKGWFALFYLAALCSVYAFYAWYQGIKILGASRTAMFNYLNPLVAVLIGILLLREPGDVNTLLGCAAIFGGVYIASLDEKEKLEKESGM